MLAAPAVCASGHCFCGSKAPRLTCPAVGSTRADLMQARVLRDEFLCGRKNLDGTYSKS